MGTSSGAPINEAVSLLSLLDPPSLEALRHEFPTIADELRVGRIGGGSDDAAMPSLERARAEVAIRALRAATSRALVELAKVQGRMRTARRRRLWAQVLTLACSSGVLASLAASEARLAIASSVLTLLASIGNLLADTGEKLLRPGQGDIYAAFEQASNASYRATSLADDIRLALRHQASGSELQALVTKANVLAEELNAWITQIAGS